MLAHRAYSICLMLSAVTLGLSGRSLAAPEDVGQWDGPFCIPVGGTHMIHLHTGKVLVFPGHYSSSTSIEAWLWTLDSACFGENPRDGFDPACWERIDNDQSNLFCAGHAAMADGRILLTGGHNEEFGAHLGLVDANIFDPQTETWSGPNDGVADMAYKRWYPTCTTLPDGRILTVSGSNRRCAGGPSAGHDCNTHADCGDGNPGGTCSGGNCVGGDQDGKACSCDRDCISTTGRCEDVVIAEIPEIYDPSSGTWSSLNSAGLAMPFYPFMFLLPEGTVFYAGVEGNYDCDYVAIPATSNRSLDVAAQTWTFVDNSTVPGGSAVMYEPGRIVKAGGNFPAVTGAERIDLTAGGAGQWQSAGSLTQARVRNNMTILADGTVLATGGTAVGNREYDYSCEGGSRDGGECSPPGFPPGDPLHGCPQGTATGNDTCPDGDCTGGTGTQYWADLAELWDPENPNVWQPMDSMVTPRMYHSTSILIPDGRVIMAGGGQGGGGIHDYHTFEIFSPPYLFKGSRPTVTAAPESIRYNDAFFIETPDADSVQKVHLIRLAAATHGYDQDQRLVPLAFTIDAPARLLVSGALVGGVEQPIDPNVAPPGYYMLFVVNGSGVPSVGRYVLVKRPPVDIWADFAYAGLEDGSFHMPFDTVAEARDAVPQSGLIRIKSSETAETIEITKPMTLESFGGPASIGVIP